MKFRLVLSFICSMQSSSIHAEPENPWDGSYTPFNGNYLVYSGDLGEQQPPTRTDRKASFMVKGPAAKEMFDSIGPDLKDACGAASGLRIRQRGDLDCTFNPDNRSAPYACHFGLNLRTGKSIPGSIC
jgi:hypothetical protein